MTADGFPGVDLKGSIRHQGPVKCTSCGGALTGPMTFCPFCGVRQDVNLRQVHFRDLGFNPSMACPECTTALSEAV
jgi:hypothetical protein